MVRGTIRDSGAPRFNTKQRQKNRRQRDSIIQTGSDSITQKNVLNAAKRDECEVSARLEQESRRDNARAEFLNGDDGKRSPCSSPGAGAARS